MANNILLLEDDMSLIDGLQYSLKKNGYAVEVARTVSEAKRLLQNIDQYDLLILDVTLPDGRCLLYSICSTQTISSCAAE